MATSSAPRIRSGNKLSPAVQRLCDQLPQTALTVSSEAGALAARLYHEAIGFGCLASDAVPSHLILLEGVNRLDLRVGFPERLEEVDKVRSVPLIRAADT